MKTITENWRPSSNDNLKTKTVNLRTSPDENKILQQAAEKLSQATGEKQNISKTIIKSVKNYVDEPYFVNQSDFRNICGVYSLALQYLQKIAADFQTLKVGAITMKDLEEIASRNFSGIKRRYNAIIEADLINVKSDIVRENMMAGVPEKFQEFQNKVLKNLENIQHCSNSCGQNYPLSVSNYTVSDGGEISFTDINKEFLKTEFCTTHIDSDAKQKFAQLQEATFKNLQELKKMLIENKAGDLLGPGALFDESRLEIFCDKETVKYILK